MIFEKTKVQGFTIVKVEGQVRLSTQTEFKDYLDGLFTDHGSSTIVLDMEKLEYINSAGIGIVVDTFKKFRDHEGRMILSGLSAELLKLFEMTKLNRFIEIYPNTEEAISKAGQDKV